MKEISDIINNYLTENNYDAWIIYDYQCKNNAFISIFGDRFLTRKVFVVFPKNDKPYIICNEIDSECFKDKVITDNFNVIQYKERNQFANIVEKNFKKYNSVVMEISDECSLPNVAYCDYGTICFIKKYIKKIDSSANLLLNFSSTLTKEMLYNHKSTMKIVENIKDKAFQLIEKKLKKHKKVTEYNIQQFIWKEFKKNGLVSDSYPIVAVNYNAGKPHYLPSKNNSAEIKKGDIILIDLWAKKNIKNGIYSDITWMGYAGNKPPQIYVDVFNVIRQSIDEALKFINENLSKRKVCGYEVDDVVRNVIKKFGYGEFFTHRTGHSISLSDSPHGNGVNIDNYETYDKRNLINNICFSIEPGIYLKDFGCREEINVCIIDGKAVVTGERQTSIVTMDL